MTRRFSDKRLLVASHNAGKIKEMREIFHALGVSVVGAKELDLPEPEETEDTFVGNARIKAHAAAKATGLPALADDSGIEVEGLGGAPGVYTADWAETPEGRDFLMAMTKTHDLLVRSAVPRPWKARFCATLVLAWPDGQDEVFEGHVYGQLVWPPRGREGHGYDPIFQPEGYDVTFAEMSWEEKNSISHRARAIQSMVSQIFD